jgi:CPA1 family monovalent cation:H+ antiporter
VTLVIQGLTLPPLIRWMGLAGGAEYNVEEVKARQAMAHGALAYLEEARESDRPEFAPIYDELAHALRRRLDSLGDDPSEQNGMRREDYEKFRSLTLQVQAVQRAAILNMRNHNEINDEVMRQLEREIDVVEMRFAPESS